MNQNGHQEDGEAKGWPDGLTVKWKVCPGCGHKGSFFDAVTDGEATIRPNGTTKLFLLPLPYETLLQKKQITAMMDICPRCGVYFCRGIVKGPVAQDVRQGGPSGRN